MHEIAVIGSGSYGTCLAKLLGDKGHKVRLWCREPELAHEIQRTRVNAPYLPGHSLGDTVRVTSELADAVTGAAFVLGVVPSHATRDVLGRAAPAMDPEAIVVNASKGLEEGTSARIDEIYADIFPAEVAHRAVFLSGPTFAVEVAAGQPSAAVAASRDPDAAQRVQAAVSTDRFRAYTSHDIVGVQIGGALKNIVAIAAGISDGLGFGQNPRAALITRGLAEIARIGVALGANPLTFSGLSGLGDLVLTCAGDLSRNRRVGLALGRGKKLDDVVSEMRMVAEGVKTTRVAHELAHKLGVRAPIIDITYQMLYEDRPPPEAIPELMTRQLKHELE